MYWESWRDCEKMGYSLKRMGKESGSIRGIQNKPIKLLAGTLTFAGLLAAVACALRSGPIITGSDSGTITEQSAVYECTRADLNISSQNANEVNLSLLDNDYTITDAGDYLFCGEYNGQICIDAEEQIVHLILKDVDIKSKVGPAISIKSAGKVIITVEQDTVNTIQDCTIYREKDKEDAAIYSCCDLTVNGSGILNVYGFYDNAIHSRDVVKILDSELYIQAQGNGIQGNDGIWIKTEQLDIECKKSGLRSTKTGNGEKGTIEIADGRVSIIAGRYAIHSSNNLYIHDCSVWSNSVLEERNVSGDSYLMEGCIENE